MSIQDLLTFISAFSVVPPAVLALVKWRNIHLKPSKLIILFIFYKLVFEAISIASSIAGNNVIFLYLYTLGEILFIRQWLLSLYYLQLRRDVIQVASAILLLSLGLELYLHWGAFITYSKTLESILFLLLCMWQFFRWLLSPNSYLYLKSPDLLAGYSLFVYFCMSLAVFAYSSQMGAAASRNLWIVHSLFNVCSNVLLFMSVYVSASRKNKASANHTTV